MTSSDKVRDGSHDFDFLFGAWEIENHRLDAPISGSSCWYEFKGKGVVRPIWGGAANMDEFEGESPKGRIHGITLRLYDQNSGQWRLYWANRTRGVLETPTIGEFKNGRGEFFDQEIFDGKAIYVRYVWSNITQDSCQWEQAFSADGGKTWETNWIMKLTRVKT